MWALFEPIHAVSYFTQPPRDAMVAIGLRGFWRGYFAGRLAPLGPVTPTVAASALFSFAAHMVSRAVPDIWSMADVDDVMTARRTGAAAAIRTALNPAPTPAEPGSPVDLAAVTSALPLLHDAAGHLDVAGRPLAAANWAVPLPEDSIEQLWQLCTLLREHRGDGHLAALACHDLDGCEILVLRSGIDLDRGQLQQARGWTDEEWAGASGRLTDRGWLGPDGRATAAGVGAHRDIEIATDDAAARPWHRLGESGTSRLAMALHEISSHVIHFMPESNPIGLPVRQSVE